MAGSRGSSFAFFLGGWIPYSADLNQSDSHRAGNDRDRGGAEFCMVTIDRILCPVDLSAFSLHALRHALALAEWYRAPITIFHAYSVPRALLPPLLAADPPLPPLIRAEEVAEEIRRFCGAAINGHEHVEILARDGTAVEKILELAEELPADLLVLGTHGRSGFERLFLGSVTEKVLRTTTVPVMTIPPPTEAGSTSYKTILCPLDFSPASMHACQYALSLAQEADARLILLNVIESVLGTGGGAENGEMRVSEYEEYLAEDAMARLKTVVPDQARLWSVPEERVARGRAYREILTVARDESVDLIVMGVHGRNPLNRLVFGSTTHHVIREARCPVLTIRG